MDTQVDIEKTLPKYLSQKCSQCFDMLKSDISGLLGGPPCIFSILTSTMSGTAGRVDQLWTKKE